MNRKLVIIAIVVFLVLGCSIIYKTLMNQTAGITATGTIEVTEVDVVPKISGYLSELTIQSGDKLRRGQLVAKISRPDLEAQLLQADAGLVRAQTQLSDLRSGARRQEREEALANLESANSVYIKAKADYERDRTLYERGAVSLQQLDHSRSAMDVASSNLAAAKSKLSLINEGNRPDVIAAQQKMVEQSQAVLAASRSAYADTLLNSPLDGVVLSKNYEQGEFVAVGSAVVTVGDYNDCWVKIFIPSTELGRIKIGQAAKVYIDSFPKRIFPGKVREIAEQAEFTPRQSLTKSERANLVFAVKVKVGNEQGLLKPGMPADVVLQ